MTHPPLDLKGIRKRSESGFTHPRDLQADVKALLSECESLRAEVALRNKRIVQTNGFLHEANKVLTEMAEALEQIDAEWCKHPSVRLEQNKNLDRDWCGHCTNWIYRGETNPAKDALEKYNSWKKESK